jgi:uncharacterized protein (TIGR01777 family)
MNTAIFLLVLQGALGAVDNLWHHELKLGLPRTPPARRELALHAARSALYAPLFLAVAWLTLGGWLAWLLAALLVIEVLVTLSDFIEEDRTRALPASERILHTLLAINYGAFLAVLAPVLVHWADQPAAVTVSPRGWCSWLFTLYAAGALGWGVRDARAAWRLSRPQLAAWQRERFQIRRCAQPQRVLIAGATGFIGRLITRRLIERGHRVVVLARDRRKALDLFGPHAQIAIALDSLRATERFDAVINLAGEPIAASRWSAARKAVLVESRIGTTRMLVQWMRRLGRPPAVFVNASAIGWYGTHSSESVSENAPAGEDFPAALCNAWEREARRARHHGTRVVILRLGLVLGSGGLLQRLLPVFRLGLGAPLGSGAQWMSWVHAEDVFAITERALADATWEGEFNVVAPQPVTNREFSAALARACTRPLWPAIPAMPLRWALGELAMVLLEGQRVQPTRLQGLGYRFRFPTLIGALHEVVDRRIQLSGKRGIEHA